MPSLHSFTRRALALKAGKRLVAATPGGVPTLHPKDMVAMEFEGVGVLCDPVVFGAAS